MKRTILLCILFLVITQGTIRAQMPETISYQGILKDASGAIVSDGQYWLEFRLYDAGEGGNELWVESHSGVQVVNGVFNVILGSISPFGLTFDREYWLSISVEGTGELSPRIPLTASPYSLNARSVSGSSNVFPSEGNVGIGTMSPVEMLSMDKGDGDGNVGIRINSLGQAEYRIGINDTDNKLYITNNDGGQGIGGNSTGIIIDQGGNVGIGTTSPSERLHVEGGNISTSGNVLCNRVQVRVSQLGGIESDGSIRFYPDTDQSGDDDIIWYDNTSNEVMRIHVDGSVGIGTNSPGAQLHAAGNWILGSTSGFPGFGVSGWLKSSDGILYEGGGGGWAHHFSAYGGGDIAYFGTSGGAGQQPDVKVVIKNDGRMGIGTSDPDASFTLHVAGNARLDGNINLQGNVNAANGTVDCSRVIVAPEGGLESGGRITFYPDTDQSGDDEIIWYDNGSNEVMRIHSDGNLGIGTTSPQSKLHIETWTDDEQVLAAFTNAGTIGSTGASIQLQRGDDSGTGTTRGMTIFAYNDRTGLADYENRHLTFWTGSGASATEKIRITNTGNVGIGTASPTDRLEVSGGNIRVSGGSFIDDGTTLNAPDYVFENDYPLMSLDELRMYVTQEKHLPNVPGAEDIEKDGLNLSEFQMRLLEKIEELTLYTLAQQEQIDDLQRQMETIQDQVRPAK